MSLRGLPEQPYNGRTIVYPARFGAPPSGSNKQIGRRGRKYGPQQKVDEFWKRFTSDNPGKVTNIIPKNEYAEKLAKRTAAKDLANGGGGGKATSTSYEEAAALCRAKVKKIVEECKRVNQKYRDPHFDLEWDLKTRTRDCLESLSNNKADYPEYFSSDDDEPRPPGPPGPGPLPGWNPRGRQREGKSRKKTKKNRGDDESEVGREIDSADESDHVRGAQTWYQKGSRKKAAEVRAESPAPKLCPRSVKRVGDIFEDPKFFIKGPTADDVRQGRDGDCWLLAAICTLSNKPGLIERVCVARDENVGVYGFVFNRDGEWFSEIIDDKLYLIKQDYDELIVDGSINVERRLWDDIENRTDPEEIFRRTYQSGSGALYFAQCENPNETWLPLLEKAYAKAHGDYQAIDGGFTAEGIEDLTGGVTSELHATDILDKDAFWNNELMKVNQDFLFGCSTGHMARGYGSRRGIVERHAYSVMRAVEIDGVRLVMLKNPWGKGEWRGAWSDGSKEWTPEWLTKLNHKFGDDGSFWMSYKDLLRKYQRFERTRLFGPDWKITSIWTTLDVPWSPQYHHTKFAFTLERSGPVVLVLAQLDERYFRGLEGRYEFLLGFRVHKTGEEDYIVRCQASGHGMSRSISVELELGAGEYTVLVLIDAEKYDHLMEPEEVLRMNVKDRRDKILRIGLSHDLALSKAKIAETEEEKAAREAYKKRQQEKHREAIRKNELDFRKKIHHQELRKIRRQKMQISHEKAWRAKQQEKREAKMQAAHEAREARMKQAEQEEADIEVVGDKAKEKVDEGTQTEVMAQEEGAAKGAEVDKEPRDREEPKVDEQISAEAKAQDESAAEKSKVDKEAQPEIGVQGNELNVNNVETAEPDVSTVGDDTPSLSSSGALAEKNLARTEASNAPAISDENVKREEVTAEPVQEATTDQKEGATIDPAKDTNITQTAALTSEPKDIDPYPEAAFKLRQALEIVSSFKTELEDLLSAKPPNQGHAGQVYPQPPQPPPMGPIYHQHPPQPHHHSASEPHHLYQHPAIPPYMHHQPGPGPQSRGSSRAASRPPSRAASRPPTAPYYPDQQQSQPLPPSRPPTFYPHPCQQQQQQFQPHPQSRAPSRPPSRTPTAPYYPDYPPPRRPYPQQQRQQPPPMDDGGYLSDTPSIMPPMTPPDLSDDELDCLVADNDEEAARYMSSMLRPRGGPLNGGDFRSESEDEFVKDPWNAVVAVGLRVYYKVEEEDKDVEGLVRIRVVRPMEWELSGDEEEEGDKKNGGEVEEENVLDVDDSAKDATVEGRLEHTA
ncbi:putative calpain-1 catalytic subunit [Triangularia setosa]|uniref:Calpain-1 catalytic subunit n=1 Tax=Triangularia setosa TaxID=2587417 RepID=A0AAN6WC27_9PEZI|nr:putative calpain-1 catalytic subunit [Podospora setosa]